MDILIYLILGCFAGLAAGLLGVGGGLIIVPVLAWVFADQGFISTQVMHLAIGTSLATIVFTSLSSIRAHQAIGAIDWKIVLLLAPGLVLGAITGASIAHFINSKGLSLFFGIFELWVAIQMSFNISPKAKRHLPRKLSTNIIAAFIGVVSSIVGIGGGTLTVPFLVWCDVHMQKAVAISAACGFPIALAGMFGFILMGKQSLVPEYAVGYVYLPALGSIIITSIIFAPLGAKLAHALPEKILKRVFAGLLYVLAIKMLLT